MARFKKGTLYTHTHRYIYIDSMTNPKKQPHFFFALVNWPVLFFDEQGGGRSFLSFFLFFIFY